MISNRNILCIANPLWEGDYAKTIVELMSVFAQQNKVLYVDNPYTIKDVLVALKGKTPFPFARAFGLKPRLRKLPAGDSTFVYVLTPPVVLSINFLPRGMLYKTLLRLNGWLVRNSIRRSLATLDMRQDLINIVAFNPALGLVNKRKLKEKLLIYHCYDEINAALWLKKHGDWIEKEFMTIADAVVVTSQGLLEKKRDLCKACFLVKNAVNIELFSKGFNPEISATKTIGYIGSIDDRLDYDMLEALIKRLPEAQFVFVGRIVYKKAEEILSKYPQVVFTGPKSVDQLPGLLHGFSLGIIPFVKNEFTQGIYPLKINEYLAAGLPVVTTHFSYLNDFEKVARIADTPQDFIEYVCEELASDSLEKKNQRLLTAKGNSWQQRVEEFSGIITQLETKANQTQA